MKKSIAILTDTNSGIKIEEAKQMGIHLILMPIFIDGEIYLEERDIAKEEFFRKQEADADISTSQPAPGEMMDKFEELLNEYEKVIFIPMSSGLSGACHHAQMLAEEYNGRVLVVDNQRISISMRQSVEDALLMIKDGKTAEEIVDYLTENALNSSIYVSVDTLKYLKKGGRITAAGAAIGEVLSIKPVLQIQGGKLDAYKKVRGNKQVMKTLLSAIKEDRDHRFQGEKCVISAAYSGDASIGEAWIAEVKAFFEDDTIRLDELPLSIATHVGGGAMGIAISKIYQSQAQQSDNAL